MHRLTSIFAGLFVLLAVVGCDGAKPGSVAKTPEGGPSAAPKAVTLTNVSYDPTRELWKELNSAFAADYQKSIGTAVSIQQSHGGSSSQARAVADGMEADVVTLSIWSDTDSLREAKLLKDGWENSFPNRSLPYTSTVVFVVRKGNPKGIKEWADLVDPAKDIEIVTPNPKTSGNGRLSFLAAWGNVTLAGGSEADATAYVRAMYQRVKKLDSGARGSTVTFVQKEQGDVQLAMENEALAQLKESGDKLDLVYPAKSILNEPHVAVVDQVVDKRGTRTQAEAYLNFLYTPAGQEIIGKHFFRPNDPAVAAKLASQFPPIERFPVTAVAKDWGDAQKRFFSEGGVFDQIQSGK